MTIPDDVPEADALEQAVEVDGEILPHGPSQDPEAPIADAIEQAEVVEEDDEDRR